MPFKTLGEGGGHMVENYYIALGVSRDADLAKIKRAYRIIVKKYHPDVSQCSDDTERFREIREAYETLADEAKRQRYDEELARRDSRLRVSKVPDLIRGRKAAVEHLEPFSSPMDELFEGLVPGFYTRERRSISKDLYFEAILSPSEARNGGLFPITVPVMEPCTRCAKSGIWEDFFCPVCLGHGAVHSERQFSLSIPPHVKHGTSIRISMEDVGLRNAYLNVIVRIDPELDEGW
jgi:molecular chaperone DnaJ